MAKRKATRAPRLRPKQRRSGQAGRKKPGARKAAGRSRAAAKKAARRKRPVPKRRVAAKSARKGRKPAPRVLRKRPAAKVARPSPRPKATPAAKPRPVAKTPVGAKPAAVRAAKRSIPVLRKPPSLDRERRIVSEDDIIQTTPPSSLDLDRTASAARTGRRVLKERFDEHTETSPALTAGDVDADWESAYSVGDEAPGGDNPTPDQDIVDDIGRAVGVEYQDNEELKSEEKIAKRDRNRWELDPASSDDWEDR